MKSIIGNIVSRGKELNWKLSLKLLLFVVATVSFVSYMSSYFPSKQDCRMVQNLDELAFDIEQKGGPDVYVFSTHIMATNLEPLLFEEKTGMSCQHFGGVNYSIGLNMEICKSVVKDHKPKCVIFDIGERASAIAEPINPYSEIMTLCPLDLSLSKIQYLNSICGDDYWSDFADGLSLTTSTVMSLNEWEKMNKKRPEYKLYKGFETRHQRDLITNMTDEDFVKIYNEVGKPSAYFSKGGSNEFREFIKELADDGIEVILIESVRMNSGEKSNLLKIKEIFEPMSNKIHVLSMDTPEKKKELSLRPKHFSDYQSLTLDGAVLFTKVLGEEINKILPRKTSDRINEFVVEDSLKFRVSDMVVTGEGDQVVQMYFDEFPDAWREYQVLLKIYPNRSDEKALSDISKEHDRDHDVVFVNFREVKKVGDLHLLHISSSFWSSLKKDQIRKIELQLYTTHLTEGIKLYSN